MSGLCKRCCGSGWQLVKVQPLEYKKCSVCNGWRTNNNGKYQKETF